MIRPVQRFIGIGLLLCTGCATPPPPAATSPSTPPTKTTLFVPGVFGDGPWYDGLRDAVAGNGSAVQTIRWGMPKALFAINFSDSGVHAKAESQLAAAIDATAGPVDLIGHSAGCGVILGALTQAHRRVGHVVLIAPSISPGYDLRLAEEAAADSIDVFYSNRDTVFLEWRCGTFGTYDGLKTPAAGYEGFIAADAKLRQHPYDPAWATLGHHGGHGGGTDGRFVRAVVLPLLRPPPPDYRERGPDLRPQAMRRGDSGVTGEPS